MLDKKKKKQSSVSNRIENYKTLLSDDISKKKKQNLNGHVLSFEFRYSRFSSKMFT